MSNVGFLVPRPSQCPDCRGGRLGMDTCDKCAGTGTVFHINGKYFPDTAKGYSDAEAELVRGAGGLDFHCGLEADDNRFLARKFDCGGLGCGTQPCCCIDLSMA